MISRVSVSFIIRHLASEGGGLAVVGPVLIVMLPTGLSREETLELCGGGKVISAQGLADRYDSVGYVAGIGVRPSDDLPARVGHAVVLDVAAWSRECLETMCVWDAADQIEPIALLERAAEGKSFAYPCWENGLVDLWDDEPVAHVVASVKHGLKEHLKRRIWSGQASVLLPFTFPDSQVDDSPIFRRLGTKGLTVSTLDQEFQRPGDQDRRSLEARIPRRPGVDQGCDLSRRTRHIEDRRRPAERHGASRHRGRAKD